jgi:type IV pilus assembly protein PilV
MAKKSNLGFTLIEVLIAMVVLSLGLLGMAKLQGTALMQNQNSYYRSQATQLAYDIADRIRANGVEAAKTSTSKYITLTPSTALEKTACGTVSTTCTPAFMAENDLYQWNQQVVAILPMGSGFVNVSGNVYTITLQWDDNRDGTVDTTSTGSANELVRMRFEI